MSELQQLKRSSKVSFQEPPLPKSSVIIWIIGIGLLVLLSWAWLFKLEEVSTGTGKIIPSSKEQVIQSLDGGILTTLNVKEGEIVECGQVLAQLDPTRFESNVGESESLLVSSRATSARLRDEVKQDQFYYWVYIRTDSDKLSNNAGQEFNITPGMVATVDIRTGSKTVMDYLIKPFNKAKEALRER